jgi:hypothetical protein
MFTIIKTYSLSIDFSRSLHGKRDVGHVDKEMNNAKRECRDEVVNEWTLLQCDKT